MIASNLKKYFLLTVACALYSCQQYHRMGIWVRLAKLTNTNSSSVEYEKLKPPLPKFVVILISRLGSHASQIDSMRKKLEEKFGERVTVIQIKCLENLKPTDQIGERNIEEICNKILSTFKNMFGSADAKKCLELPMHILDYGEINLVTAIANPNSVSLEEFDLIFNIKSLSLADHKGPAKEHIDIHVFKNSSITLDYIDFLEQQQE